MSTVNTVPAGVNVLSLAAAKDKAALSSGDAWLLLLDVNWQGQHIRLARNTDSVRFDAGDGLGIQTYQAFAFDLTVERTSGGQLPSITLKASNVLGILQGLVEQYSGAVGATVTLYVLNTAHAALSIANFAEVVTSLQVGGEPDLAMSMTILQTTCTAESVSFQLGAPKPQKMLFPKYLYRAEYCMWIYKGAQCKYAGPLATCDLTFTGANGCKAHGNQLNFGAFPGIGTNGGAIASQT